MNGQNHSSSGSHHPVKKFPHSQQNFWSLLLSLSELGPGHGWFFPLIQKKKISMTYGSSTGSWKPWKWMRLNLILLNRDIHQFQPGHIHIASNRTSLRWSKNHCNWQKNSLKGKLIQTGKTTWSEFTIGGNAILIKKKVRQGLLLAFVGGDHHSQSSALNFEKKKTFSLEIAKNDICLRGCKLAKCFLCSKNIP